MATQVAIGDLSTWLSQQPINTIDTPYEIEVTGITLSNIENLKSLKPITKYVDLSTTVLPNGLTDLNTTQLFVGNYFLVKAPILPTGLTNMQGAFGSCRALKEAPAIPNTVTNLSSAFEGCTSLVTPPVIQHNTPVTNGFYMTFKDCTSLVSAPVIPDSVTYMAWAFLNCTSLKNAPVIPSNVTHIMRAFENCTSLEYKPVIPSSATYTTDCYKGVTQTRWGALSSQLDSWIASQTTEFDIVEIEEDTENNCYEMTGREVYGVDISNLDTWLSDHESTTRDNPYEVKVLSLTSSNLSTLSSDLRSVRYDYKYLDLRYTVLPSVTNIDELFLECSGLVYSPAIPSGVISMVSTFEMCEALEVAPTIPSGVLDMESTFNGTVNLITPPAIPSGVTSLKNTFLGSSIETAPTIPSSVTNMEGTFTRTVISSAPAIPNGVTTLKNCFNSTHITNCPVIPSSVTNIESAFSSCNRITEVQIVPSSITNAKQAFAYCTSLRKITEFQIPLNTLKNNANFQNMFQGCTSLTEIGYVIRESSWHVWRLKFGTNTVQGKVFFDENTSVNIPQTSITKTDVQLPILTDELWFPTESDSDIESIIAKMLQYHYGVFKKEVIPPDEKSFVLMADDPDNVITNLITNTVQSGNMSAVTSNAVAQAVSSLQPVDTVTSGNMHSVTSNAIASAMLLPKTLTSYYFYTQDTIKTPIPVNAGETEAIGYLLMYMGHTDAGDRTFVELYLIRVGYSGNNHTETLIASSGNVGSYHPTFGVSNDGYLTVYVPRKSRVCIY